VGSGAQMATGVLEQGYNQEMTQNDAKNLVLKAMKSAIRRDVMSGNGVDLLIITKEGITENTIKF
jgi:proteasome beta subunit